MIIVTLGDLFPIATRNKDGEDSKLVEGQKTALGRRASGVTNKTSKPGEQVCDNHVAYYLVSRNQAVISAQMTLLSSGS